MPKGKRRAERERKARERKTEHASSERLSKYARKRVDQAAGRFRPTSPFFGEETDKADG